MSTILRNAIKEDCPAMLELVKELATYEQAPNEVTISFEHFEESGFGEKPVWEAWIVEVDGVLVGFALCYIRFSTWKGQRLYLEDIIVTESMRGQGLGKLLMDKLIEVCKERKYSGLVWQVLDWNKPAIDFYKRYNTNFDDEWINCSLCF